jgi:hypothetical protein
MSGLMPEVDYLRLVTEIVTGAGQEGISQEDVAAGIAIFETFLIHAALIKGWQGGIFQVKGYNPETGDLSWGNTDPKLAAFIAERLETVN